MLWRETVIAQLCPTLCDPMDCSPPGSSVRGIFQTRILEWVDNPSSRGSSWPKGQTWVSPLAGRFFTIWATREGLALKTLPTFAWQFSLWFCCFTFPVVKSWLISTFPQALSLSSIRTGNTHFWYCSQLFGFPGGSESKVSAYNAGDQVWIPGREDPLEKEMATHSSILAWEVPWTENSGRLQSMGLQRVGHGWATLLSLIFFLSQLQSLFPCAQARHLAHNKSSINICRIT